MICWDKVDLVLNIIGNAFTILASGLAIWIFFANRDKISSAFSMLLNYSHQITLNDLKMKVERLNDFTVNDEEQKIQIIYILNEIDGQIEGSRMLTKMLSAQSIKIKSIITNHKRFNEADKRSLVSNLKESIRDVDLSRFNNADIS